MLSEPRFYMNLQTRNNNYHHQEQDRPRRANRIQPRHNGNRRGPTGIQNLDGISPPFRNALKLNSHIIDIANSRADLRTIHHVNHVNRKHYVTLCDTILREWCNAVEKKYKLRHWRKYISRVNDCCSGWALTFFHVVLKEAEMGAILGLFLGTGVVLVSYF